MYEYDPKFWTETETPKRKKDYEGRYIKLLVDSPNVRGGWQSKPSLLKAGSILYIVSRVNQGQAAMSSFPCNSSVYSDSKDRVLKVQWHCPHCDTSHYEGLPEAWLNEDKLVFVEKKTPEELSATA